MIRKVKLAKINLTMQTGTIVRWLKKEGERVEQDEPLLEVETDKAVNTVESFYSGYLKKILVPEGQEVPIDTLIAYIGEKEDEVPAAAARKPRPAVGQQVQAAAAPGRPAPAGAAGAHAAGAPAARQAQGRDPERLAPGAAAGHRAGRGPGRGGRQWARRPHQQGRRTGSRARGGSLPARGRRGSRAGSTGRRRFLRPRHLPGGALASPVQPEEAHRRAHEIQLPGGAAHLPGRVGPSRSPGGPACPAECRSRGSATRTTLYPD